jgi:hypothetical protein
MTISIIIQILSIVMLMLLALPGTQWIWKSEIWGVRKFGNSVIGKFFVPIAIEREMVKSGRKIEVKEITKPGLFRELSKIAAAIF